MIRAIHQIFCTFCLSRQVVSRINCKTTSLFQVVSVSRLRRQTWNCGISASEDMPTIFPAQCWWQGWQHAPTVQASFLPRVSKLRRFGLAGLVLKGRDVGSGRGNLRGFLDTKLATWGMECAYFCWVDMSGGHSIHFGHSSRLMLDICRVSIAHTLKPSQRPISIPALTSRGQVARLRTIKGT